MAPGRMRLLGLNGSEEDPGLDIDLTLSLSVGDSRGKKVVSLEQKTSTHIANQRETDFGHKRFTSTTGGKSTNGFSNGGPAYCPIHEKLSELLAGARSSSVVMSKESRTVQGSVSTLSTARNNSFATQNNSCTAGSVLHQHRLQPHPSINSVPSYTNSISTNGNIVSKVSHMPCVTVRDSRPGTPRATGFIYQASSPSDVVIVCACHWQAFSAAGFVEHAGLTNVKNPLREIVVLPLTNVHAMIGPEP